MRDPVSPRGSPLGCVHLLGRTPVPRVCWLHSPASTPHRAHFLQGAFSEEELAQLGGQDVATLSPTTRWEIHNISGVRGEFWAEERTVQGPGGHLSDH